jgi:UDP-N-acetylmuramoylalanine--D-glutamate ligase
MELAGRRIVLFGLGVSGMAVLDFLLIRGAVVAVSERRNFAELDRQEQEAVGSLELETGGHSIGFVGGAELIVVSPGVPLDLEVLKEVQSRGVPIVGELALAAGEFKTPVIGITGSNGKTTVTKLVGTLLKSAGFNPFIGGNIGTPLLLALTEPEQYDIMVLELSSFQLDIGGSFRPDIGLLLNFSPDHLDRHGSMEAYIRAKWKLFDNQSSADAAIFGGNDSLIMENMKKRGCTGKSLLFGHGDTTQAKIVGSTVILDLGGEQEEFSLGGTALDSGVNLLNSAAAILAATVAGATPAGIRTGLVSFVLPPHRMTLIAQKGGVRFINDSKATNVGAMMAAVGSLEGSHNILIAGGRDKDGDFEAARELVADKISYMLCLGEAADMLISVFGETVLAKKVESMERAVAMAVSLAEPKCTIILSPGCASFDMFSGYAQRGKVFTELVLQMIRDEEGRQKTGRMGDG